MEEILMVSIMHSCPWASSSAFASGPGLSASPSLQSIATNNLFPSLGLAPLLQASPESPTC
eukprot:5935250-Alexandrium_andersonii.AAC.1